MAPFLLRRLVVYQKMKRGIVMGGAILCDMLPSGLRAVPFRLFFGLLGGIRPGLKHFPDHFDRWSGFFILLGLATLFLFWRRFIFRQSCKLRDTLHDIIEKKRNCFPAIACLLANIIGGAGILLAYFGSSRNQAPLTLYGNVDIRQAGPGFRVGGRIAEVLGDEGDKPGGRAALWPGWMPIFWLQQNRAAASLGGPESPACRLERGYRVQEVAQARGQSVAAAGRGRQCRPKICIACRPCAEKTRCSPKELDNARAQDREAKARLKEAQDNLDMLSSGFREEEVSAQKAAVDEAEAQFAMAESSFDDAAPCPRKRHCTWLIGPGKGAIVDAGRQSILPNPL